jgi:hypothetical protein
MTSEDWRSPARYDELRSLDGPGFAWEYLRRNNAFIRQRTSLERADRCGKLDPGDAEAFARRWGVRFHECRQRLDGQSRSVDGASASHGHRAGRPPRKPRDT